MGVLQDINHLARNQTYEEINGFTNPESTILAAKTGCKISRCVWMALSLGCIVFGS